MQQGPALLKKLGFVQEATEQAMIFDLKEFKALPLKTDLKIKMVDKECLSSFLSILKVYDAYAEKLYLKLEGNIQSLDEKMFIGFIDEVPVSIAVLYTSNEVSGVFSVITKEEYRGRGYGSDVMRYLLNYANTLGSKKVTLSASSDSACNLYKRLGFEIVGNFECYEYLR